MNKVYKVLLEEDGELKSTIAGRGLEGYLAQDKPRLTYKEGQITYAPEGTVGLFFGETLDKAKEYAKNIPHTKGTVRIHEATPLGNREHLVFCGYTYPALLLGKEVWREEAREEAPRPEPKFKVGDKVFDIRGREEPFVITVVGWGTDSKEPCFRGHEHYHYGKEGTTLEDNAGSLTDECFLEFAPKEEWVDVTSECEVRGYKTYSSLVGELIHKGRILAWLSYDGIAPSFSCPDGYKLEPVREWEKGGKFYHWVRVFHKQAI